MSNHSESIWLPLLLSTASSVVSVACMPGERASELGAYHGGQQSGAAAQDAQAPAPPAPDSTVPEQPIVDASVLPPSAPELAGLAFAPIEANVDPDRRCYELRAHAAEDRRKPYVVPTTPDQYVNYTFESPWTGMQVLQVIRPIVDATEVIHRFRLYANPRATPAGVSASDRDHRGAELLATWMPGGEPVYFQNNTGILLSDTASYTLEVHYNNVTEAPLADASGFELCVTPRPARFLLGLSQIGGDKPTGSTIQNRCTPTEGQESIWIYGLRTQLDLTGRHVNVTLHRATGTSEVVLDEAVNFDSQRSHATKLELRPGDSLTTTCSYARPAQIGPSVYDSACNVYAYHAPAYWLATPGANSPEGVGTCRD